MKALIVLSVLQIGILVFLFGRIVVIEDELNATGHVEYGNPSRGDIYEPPADSFARGNYDSSIEPLLRNIVREELAAQLAALPGPVLQSPATIAADPIDPDEYQYQFDSVIQKLDIYESVGSISDADMQNLQTEIMTLNNAADREQALSRLVRAMNSGALKGRL